ncbi:MULTISPECIES: hypothetical protein [Enterobacterales]|jgi:hypothetical protein|uniref:hypothetical protein n=1 Tax=Enterobacterales TaxID=91347 RepID=UPI000565E463|nr:MULTISPECIES: hypothetical protein [Enterobacterales]KAJ9430456.1 hypothetical protein PMI39_023105 [Pantoea sp. YR343]MBB3307682.1 hypothetical protein [Enterobacter sp. Sphag1F]NYI16494.1 hypothetical protein [Enterobacter sp. Sphag71]
MFKKMVYTLVLSLYSLTKCTAEPDNNLWLNPDAFHSVHSGYIEGYENFIFAVPDKNISGDEAKSHRLDPNRKHQKLKALKKGQNQKSSSYIG